MRTKILLRAGFVCVALLGSSQLHAQTKGHVLQTSNDRQSGDVIQLAFPEFFLPSEAELKPSPKLLSANGKRVRLVGFMAQMEEPPKGAFYLVPKPLYCDEGGGGTGDLPPQSVLVIVRSAKDKPLEFIPRALAVTGILQIGESDDPLTASAPLRLILDQRQPNRYSAPRSRRFDDHSKSGSKRKFSEEK